MCNNSSNYIQLVKMFIPNEATVLTVSDEYPALYMLDINGDQAIEILAVYSYENQSYIIILKYTYVGWRVLAYRKGVGTHIINMFALYNSNTCALTPVIEWRTHSNDSVFQHIDISNKRIETAIDFSNVTFIESEKRKDRRLEDAFAKVFNLRRRIDKVNYYYNWVDLNDDGKKEVFVYVTGVAVCGTGGCSAAIFNEDYQLLSKFSLARTPIFILTNKTNGYRDIILPVSGGGIEPFYAWLTFSEGSYPQNPSIQAAVPHGLRIEGTAIIADDLTKNKGIPFN